MFRFFLTSWRASVTQNSARLGIGYDKWNKLVKTQFGPKSNRREINWKGAALSGCARSHTAAGFTRRLKHLRVSNGWSDRQAVPAAKPPRPVARRWPAINQSWLFIR
jgi:hypothetical protein